VRSGTPDLVEALDLALEHPQRVRALVLIGPAVSGAPDFGPHSDEIESFWKLVEAAEERGDLDEGNRLEARAWLDGVAAPDGRVTDPVRSLFFDMNARLPVVGAPSPHCHVARCG
jgi:pimeloyl-ACP methyl ester carboxylesterase